MHMTSSDSEIHERDRAIAALRSRLMHALELRWDHGTWVYDGATIDLIGEPFVLGADTMLTVLRGLHVGPGREPFRLVFSSQQFPGALEARHSGADEASGDWYEAKLGDQIFRGWLCGHLLDYFETAPERLYVRAEAASTE
jgi:hypothetical protein